MEYLRLSDCSNFASDRTSNITFENYISTENMIPNKGGVTIASSLPDVKTTSAYKPNDILLSNIRPYFCKIWLADKEGSCSNDVLVVRAKEKINPKFLYYVLSDNNFFNWDNATSKGTKMPRGTPNAIMKYFVPDVGESVQQKIANILSRYDEAIENNSKRIKLLEQMAQSLYKEWFVRFRFPGWQNVEFENGMPKGWKYGKIGECGEIIGGGTPSTDTEEFWDGDIPWLTPADLSEFDYIYIKKGSHNITELGLKKSSAKLMPKNTVLLSSRAPVGYVAIAQNEISTNQGFKSVICNGKILNYAYLYYFFKLNTVALQNFATGATFPELSSSMLKRIKILIPKIELQNQFCDLVIPLFNEINILADKIANLSAQRDLLLPRLMSGKLEV